MNSDVMTTDNELDIQKLFKLLWQGKAWIIGLAMLFASIALGYSYIVKQEWVSSSVTTKPSITLLKNYYQQKNFLQSLDKENSAQPIESIPTEVYQEFTQQLGSYDARREFWQQSDYFLSRTENDAKADAALLEEFINNIVFTPSDLKNPFDTLQLTAETAQEAKSLLDSYITFVAADVVADLNNEISVLWNEKKKQLEIENTQQEVAGKANYSKDILLLEKAIQKLKLKQVSQEQQSQLESLSMSLADLEITGPQFSERYFENKVLLSKLASLNIEEFQPYRFLKKPIEPVKRTKPRRLFLLILWGGVGAFCGGVITLTRAAAQRRREA